MNNIFISYCHSDEKWKDRIIKHLQPLIKKGDFNVWSDRKIEMGELWLPEIQEAIKESNLSLALVSADYLNSEFITKLEVPALIDKRNENPDFKIIPIIISSCSWNLTDWISSTQGYPKNNKPLRSFKEYEIDFILTDLADEIYKEFNSSYNYKFLNIPPKQESNENFYNCKIKNRLLRLLIAGNIENQYIREAFYFQLKKYSEKEIISSFWNPENPREMVKTLRICTKSALDRLIEEEKKYELFEKVWNISIKILDCISVFFISNEWLEQEQKKNEPHYNIELRKNIGVKLLSAKINETSAKLKDLNDLIGNHSLAKENFVPESGWPESGSIGTVIQEVHKKYYKGKTHIEGYVPIDPILKLVEENSGSIYDLTYLNTRIEMKHEQDDDNYFLAIDANNSSHPIQDINSARRLKAYLPAMPILKFGIEHKEKEKMFVIEEPRVVGYIGNFLDLVKEYEWNENNT